MLRHVMCDALALCHMTEHGVDWCTAKHGVNIFDTKSPILRLAKTCMDGNVLIFIVDFAFVGV